MINPEKFCTKLSIFQDHYKNAVVNNMYHKRVELTTGEVIVVHNPGVIVSFGSSGQPDEWGTTQVGLTGGRMSDIIIPNIFCIYI